MSHFKLQISRCDRHLKSVGISCHFLGKTKMQTFNFFQKASLTLITLNLSLTGGKAVAGSFSGSTFAPGKIDSPIAGFVGSDGLGVVSPNNTVNPIFTGWATGFTNYQPAPGVLEQWQTPEKTLGEVTGAFDDIAS